MVAGKWSARVFASAVLAASILVSTTPSANASNNPVPLVNQPLVPSTVEPGSHGLAITVNGTGFVSTSVVNWNGTPLSTLYVNFGQLQATVPDSDVASAGTASVTVTNPAPGGGTSNPASFTVTTPTTSVGFTSALHSVAVEPNGIFAADFNGDGVADLAVFGESSPSCTEVSGAIAILLGDGHGGFIKKSVICAAFRLPFHAVTGDFNHDGKTDLAVIAGAGCMGCAAVTIYLGNGDGTFVEFANPLMLDGALNDIVTADFNGDGNLDLAVAYDSGEGPSDVVIFLGNGDGTFTPYVDLSDGGYLATSSLAAGDFNNDGIIDLVLLGEGDYGGEIIGPVSIYLGNGNGTFALDASQPSLTMNDPISVITGDFTGDGILDLVVLDNGTNAFTILKGNGDATFTQVAGTQTLPPNATLIGTADFNGDGKLDLAFSSAPNIVAIYLGNGDGTFQPGITQSVKNGQFEDSYYQSVGAIADFNSDGRADIAIANTSQTFFILKQADIPLRPAITLMSGQNPAYVNQLVTYTAVVSAGLTGSVTFKEGSNVLGTLPLSNGQASLPVAFPKPGSFPVVAIYSGPTNFGPKYSSVKQVVSKYPTNNSFGFSDDQGQPVTLTAVVTSAGPVPTGKVIFKNGSITLGSASLVNGVATLTISHLPSAQPSFAIYNGDAVSEKSISNPWPLPF
jgi:hypothetical protein